MLIPSADDEIAEVQMLEVDTVVTVTVVLDDAMLVGTKEKKQAKN